MKDISKQCSADRSPVDCFPAAHLVPGPPSSSDADMAYIHPVAVVHPEMAVYVSRLRSRDSHCCSCDVAAGRGYFVVAQEARTRAAVVTGLVEGHRRCIAAEWVVVAADV